jgi:hypothetical protein
MRVAGVAARGGAADRDRGGGALRERLRALRDCVDPHCCDAPVHTTRVLPSAIAPVSRCVTVTRRNARSPAVHERGPVTTSWRPPSVATAVGSIVLVTILANAAGASSATTAATIEVVRAWGMATPPRRFTPSTAPSVK